MEQLEPITIKFEGGGIKPSVVKASEIGELLKNFEASLLSVAKKQSSDINEDNVAISFQEIRESSLSLKHIPYFLAITAALSTIGGYFQTNNFDDLNEATIENLRVFTRFATKHNCIGKIFQGSTEIASFDKNTVINYSEHGILRGETTIYGEVKRAGGDKPRVTLKINDEYTISFDASKEIVIQLASNLYQEVGLSGTAKWNKRDYKILDFKPTEVIVLNNEEPLTKTFETLSTFFSKDDLDNFDLIL